MRRIFSTSLSSGETVLPTISDEELDTVERVVRSKVRVLSNRDVPGNRDMADEVKDYNLKRLCQVYLAKKNRGVEDASRTKAR